MNAMSIPTKKMTIEEERIMIENAQKDLRQFTPLYEYYLPKIHRYLSCKIRDVTIAEDLTAQTFCEALENISAFTWKGISFGAWLYKIAYHLLVDHYRLSKPEALHDEQSASNEDVTEIVNTTWSLEKIYEVLRTLPALSQQVVTLRVTEDLSHREIGFILGKSEDNVKVIYSRAIQTLRGIIIVSLFLFVYFYHFYG